MGHGSEMIKNIKADGTEQLLQVPKAKATMADFILALKMSLGSNTVGWAQRSLKPNKGKWYMPALERKLLFLNKYFITLIVWLFGIIVCAAMLKVGLTTTQIFILMVAFSVVDVLLISPLIYLAVLPKPIAAYIKDVDDLTPEEMRAYEKQLKYDPRLEKLMYGYRDRRNEKGSISNFFNRKK